MPFDSRRLIVAVLASVALIVTAPWIGTVRAWIQAAAPGRFGLVVNLLVAAAVVAAGIAAVVRIRTRRAFRYGVLAGALALAVLSAALTASASSSQNAVERFHFVSFGLITFLFYRAAQVDDAADLSLIGLPAIAALLVATVDEWFQWFVPGRYGEVRDIFLNAAAIVSGLLFSVGASPPARWSVRTRGSSARALAITLAAWVLTLAAFIHAVHLGHAIDDPQVGTFRSRYTGAQLRSLAVDRQAEWRRHPPPAQMPRMAREDQYLAEAVWHIMARNAAWTGDGGTAWSENLILEKYFGPVLDTSSYAAAVSRWPAAQRADAEGRIGSGHAGRRFVSAAERHPIWTWPPIALWGAALALAAALAASGGRSRSIVRR